MPRLTQQQLETHLWGAANILRGRTAGQDYKTYILSLMFFKRLSDQWDFEADEKIDQLEKERGRPFTDAQRQALRARGDLHRFTIPGGCHWSDVLAVSEFHHMRINHREQFADRGNHINGIENFWNQAKRHLRRYNGIPRTQFPLYLQGRSSPSTSRNANGASTTAPQTACSQP